MADCWSCGAERGGALFCPTCQKIQPPRPEVNFFDVLGLETKMAQDRAEIEKRFREVSQRVHPDRYGQASSVERKLALAHTERVNQAYRALRVPHSRAEHLMDLQRYESPKDRRAQSSEFLMEMLELQESIDHKTEDGLEDLQADVRARMNSNYASLEAYFDREDGAPDTAVDALDELRYLRRLEERIEHRLEEM